MRTNCVRAPGAEPMPAKPLLSSCIGPVRLPGRAINGALAQLDNSQAWSQVAERLGLSSQELNVALHILAGQKLTAVSWELDLALGMVKTYCQRIYHKLRVSDHCTVAFEYRSLRR